MKQQLWASNYLSTVFPFQQLPSLAGGAATSSLLHNMYGRLDQNRFESFTRWRMSFTSLSIGSRLPSSSSVCFRLFLRLLLRLVLALPPVWAWFGGLLLLVNWISPLENWTGSYFSSRLDESCADRFVICCFSFWTCSSSRMKISLSSCEERCAALSTLRRFRNSSGSMRGTKLVALRRRPSAGLPQPWNTRLEMSWPVSCKVKVKQLALRILC